MKTCPSTYRSRKVQVAAPFPYRKPSTVITRGALQFRAFALRIDSNRLSLVSQCLSEDLKGSSRSSIASLRTTHENSLETCRSTREWG